MWCRVQCCVEVALCVSSSAGRVLAGCAACLQLQQSNGMDCHHPQLIPSTHIPCLVSPRYLLLPPFARLVITLRTARIRDKSQPRTTLSLSEKSDEKQMTRYLRSSTVPGTLLIEIPIPLTGPTRARPARSSNRSPSSIVHCQCSSGFFQGPDVQRAAINGAQPGSPIAACRPPGPRNQLGFKKKKNP